MALRYLNPIRTHVSVITMISLIGVATGVMVLVVVLSVMNGFEGFLKKQILGQAPHITLQRTAPWQDSLENPELPSPEEEWRDLQTKLSNVPSVSSSYAFLVDYVITDMNGSIDPAYMRAIDTDNKQQMDELASIIKPGNGSADLGMGETAVISTLFAEEMGIAVGDTLRVHSNRGFKQVKPIFDRLKLKSAYQRYKDTFDNYTNDFTQAWNTDGDREVISRQAVRTFGLELIKPLKDDARDSRAGERAICEEILDELKSDREKGEETYFYVKGKLATINGLLEKLRNADAEQMDNEELRAMESVILPKELEVVGKYTSSRFSPGPALIVPLSVGQDLADIDGGGIQALAVKLDDPYKADQVYQQHFKQFERNGLWQGVTWSEKHKGQFAVITQQKGMMIVALSFIVLVAVFSISAVMFTVTVQKKREIGVMKALGATPAQIVKVFSYQGVIVGILGSALGVGLGMLALRYIDGILAVLREVGIDPFGAAVYQFDKMPVEVRPTEITIIAVGAFVCCTLATLLPAYLASRSDAARSLRNL